MDVSEGILALVDWRHLRYGKVKDLLIGRESSLFEVVFDGVHPAWLALHLEYLLIIFIIVGFFTHFEVSCSSLVRAL